MNWLADNWGTLLVSLLLLLVVGAILYRLIRNKKKGKSVCGCGCGCAGCSMSGSCHPQA